MQKVDGKGLLCPQPLILTRRALKECLPGETIHVEVDNQTAFQNVMTFLTDQHLDPVGSEKEGLFTIEAQFKAPLPDEKPEVPDAEPVTCPTNYVVVISSDKMGDGDPLLGAILMKAFLNALPDQPQLPTHLLLYNAGVKMATDISGVDAALQSLAAKGVEILLCGTCVDFYVIRSQIVAGRITDMFTLTKTMAEAGHIVRP
ncbi:MAG: sulfurtransferase-like selenium metabolism protein YedF [Marinilabiliales bacterium]|nr:sulfurtransferase-like selenium metabolism protein YedF [Marinilabiliales bacterium]